MFKFILTEVKKMTPWVLALPLLLSAHQAFGTDEKTIGGDLGQMKASADSVIQQAQRDSGATLNTGPVFDCADALMASGREAEALDYLKNGLDLNPWRLEEQLVLAGWYSKQKRDKEAGEILDYVLQFAEKETLREAALKGLGKPSEKFTVEKAAALPGSGPVVVIVPVGDVETWILGRLSGDIKLDLGVPVSIVSLGIDPGPATRDPLAVFLNQMRGAAKKDPALSAKVRDLARKKGIGEPELWVGETFIPFFLAALKAAGRKEDAARFEMILSVVRGAALQWDAARLMHEIKKQAGPWAREGAVFVGVTNLDMGSKDLNFQFGLAEPGTGLISYHRFTAEFNHKPPNAPLLTRRIEKQALSSIGFTYGVVRCSSKWCARAYPNSLEEHDVKENKLCDQCREGFGKVFAKYGWDQPIPVDPGKNDPNP